MWVFLILGLLIIGFLIAVSFSGVLNLTSFAPSPENVLNAEFLNLCQSKLSIYSHAGIESNRKSFCCSNVDLNSNNVISTDEYCSHFCTNCHTGGLSAQELCSDEPINYYINMELC